MLADHRVDYSDVGGCRNSYPCPCCGGGVQEPPKKKPLWERVLLWCTQPSTKEPKKTVSRKPAKPNFFEPVKRAPYKQPRHKKKHGRQ